MLFPGLVKYSYCKGSHLGVSMQNAELSPLDGVRCAKKMQPLSTIIMFLISVLLLATTCHSISDLSRRDPVLKSKLFLKTRGDAPLVRNVYAVADIGLRPMVISPKGKELLYGHVSLLSTGSASVVVRSGWGTSTAIANFIAPRFCTIRNVLSRIFTGLPPRRWHFAGRSHSD